MGPNSGKLFTLNICHSWNLWSVPVQTQLPCVLPVLDTDLVCLELICGLPIFGIESTLLQVDIKDNRNTLNNMPRIIETS